MSAATMEEVPYLGHLIRRWQIGSSTFLAWPEAGARLMHWSVLRGDGSVRDVVHWPEVTQLESVAKVRGGNPILFPFCGRVFDGGEIHWWRDAKGVRRPMPMHGFARQGQFRLTQIKPSGFDATLEPNEAAREAYPFDYEFAVSYRFSALSLACELKLTNHGPEPIPWSAGHHFYFAVPWDEHHRREDYRLDLAAGRVVRQDADGGLSDSPRVPRQPSLADPDLIDAIHLRLKKATCSFGPTDGSEKVDVRIGAGGGPAPDNAVVTWSSSPEAPFYCVEPWMGPPNAPGHGIGLHWVNPGQSERFCVEVALR